VFVQALPGAASFAACLRLFRCYPLAVTSPAVTGGYRSMVLMSRAPGSAGFYVLTHVGDDLFVIRSWDGRDGLAQQIRPGEPVSGVIRQVISDGMPLPRDGALLGWVTDCQVTVMLAVRCPRPRTPATPGLFPEILVMLLVCISCPLHWPPSSASTLDERR